jgi:hypothetical protein
MTVGRVKRASIQTLQRREKRPRFLRESIVLSPFRKLGRFRNYLRLWTSWPEENARLKDKIAVGQWDATEIEKIDVQQLIAELGAIRILESITKLLS